MPKPQTNTNSDAYFLIVIVIIFAWMLSKANTTKKITEEYKEKKKKSVKMSDNKAAEQTTAKAAPAPEVTNSKPNGVDEAFSQTGKASGDVVKGTFNVTGQTLKGIGKGIAYPFTKDSKKD